MNYLDSELCKGCKICMNACKKDVYDVSTKTNKKGVLVLYPKNQENCVQCGLCEIMCPDQAIMVDKDE